MKTLKKAIRYSVILVVLVTLLITPLIFMSVQNAVTIGEQLLDLDFAFGEPDTATSLYYGCCGSGNGGGPD